MHQGRSPRSDLSGRIVRRTVTNAVVFIAGRKRQLEEFLAFEPVVA
jgi:hypothetical protein